MFITAVFIIGQDLMEKLDHVIFYIPVVPDWILVDNIFARVDTFYHCERYI